jgi:hypothetical protein
MILSGSVPCFKNKTSKNDKNNFNKMKIRILIITIGLFSIISCNNHCVIDKDFKDVYFRMLDTITSYGKQFDTDGWVLFEDEKCRNFSECTDYLTYLTNHEFRFFILESQAIYEKQSDLKANIKELKKWYNTNKCGMTIEKADSLVKAENERLSIKIPPPKMPLQPRPKVKKTVKQ